MRNRWLNVYVILFTGCLVPITDTYGATINAPGAIELTSITDISLTVTAGGAITDAATAQITITGNANFDAGTNPITLGDTLGDLFNVGSLSLVGGDVSVTEDSATELINATATTLSLTSSGPITDNPGAALSVSGAATFSGNAVILDDTGNDFGSVGGNADSGSFTVVDNNDLMVAQITTNNGNVSLTANTLSLDQNINAGTGQVFLKGAVELADDIDIIGSQMTIDGSLTIDLFGVGEANYEQLFVTGDALIDGIISVDLNGFTPGLGDSFDVIEAANIDLMLAALDLPTLSGGLFFQTSIVEGLNSETLRLTAAVVPVPAAFWLFGTALIGLVGFRTRKATSLQ